MWQDWAGGRELQGWFLGEKGLPPHETEPVLSSSRVDPLQDTPEPISPDDRAAVITYLRKHKIYCVAAVRERSEKNMREKSLLTPRSVEKEEEEVLHMLEQRFLFSSWSRPW